MVRMSSNYTCGECVCDSPFSPSVMTSNVWTSFDRHMIDQSDSQSFKFMAIHKITPFSLDMHTLKN